MGVNWDKQNKKWRASLTYNKKKVHIGFFTNQNDAAKAVNWKCEELKISLKNPQVGFLDDEELAQLKFNVIDFYHCFVLLFLLV